MSKARKPAKRSKTPAERQQPSVPGGDSEGTEFLRELAGTLDLINDHLVSRKGDIQSIMIVEDDDDGREILSSVLEHAGYVTMSVASGKEALEKLTKVLPSLIILDLQMPGIDGWTVERNLKADPKLRTIPVVITSAFANMASARTGVGADAWFQKPIDLQGLLKALPPLMTNTASMAAPEA